MLSKVYAEARGTTPMPTVTLKERPDEARLHLRLSAQTDSASAALPLLRRAVQRVDEVVGPLGARTEVTDFDVPNEPGKLVDAPSALHVAVVLPFGAADDFWTRATHLAQLDDVLRALLLELKKQKQVVELKRDLPVFVVKDPEHFRRQLITRIHERACSLCPGRPVKVSGVAFDRSVTQRSLGLQAVELSLAVEGVAEFEVAG